jgi:hypothetical protein
VEGGEGVGEEGLADGVDVVWLGWLVWGDMSWKGGGAY